MDDSAGSGADNEAVDSVADPADGGADKTKRLSKAEKLELKAAKLREAAQRAEQEAAKSVAGTQPAAGGTVSGRRGRRGWLLVVAGVAIVGLAVALALVSVRLEDRDDALHQAHRDAAAQAPLESLRDSALSAAKKYAVDFGSYDYTKLDQDFQLVSSHLTKSFAAKYAQISQQLESVIVQYKGKSTAAVQGAGVSSIAGKQAVVVLFLDQTVTTTQSKQPRVDRNRLTMTLQLQPDGSWLISDMALV